MFLEKRKTVNERLNGMMEDIRKAKGKSEEEIEKDMEERVKNELSGGHNTWESCLRQAARWYRRARHTGNRIKVSIEPSPTHPEGDLQVEGDVLEWNQEREEWVREKETDMRRVLEVIERLERMDRDAEELEAMAKDLREEIMEDMDEYEDLDLEHMKGEQNDG